AQNITITDSTYQFDFKTPYETLSRVRFNKPGKHNLLNALAAMAMATTLGTPLGHIAKALETFKGIKRRFTYHINERDLVYIDDYAHHPTEIEAVHQAVRSAHPDKKVTVVFQPHLYSRTKDFAQEFAKSLADFDEIILLDIYPAREQPIEGVDSDWLLNLINHSCKHKVAKEQLCEVLHKSTSKVYLTLGAGDIGQEVNSIKKVLSEKYIDFIKISLAVLGLVFLFSFSNIRNNNRVLPMKTSVEFLNDDAHFITRSTVNKLLIQNRDSASVITKDQLAMSKVEESLNAHSMVEHADVYVTINGEIGAKVRQRTPIARVIGEQGYYMDSYGEKMPLSPVHSARVPLITGDDVDKSWSSLYELVKYIHEDDFLKKTITGIHL